MNAHKNLPWYIYSDRKQNTRIQVQPAGMSYPCCLLLGQVCSALHQRYADFGPAIGPALARVFSPAAKGGSEDGKRRRAALRLLTELIAAGVSSDASLLTGIMRELVGRPLLCCT